jgi:hypothetical protein
MCLRDAAFEAPSRFGCVSWVSFFARPKVKKSAFIKACGRLVTTFLTSPYKAVDISSAPLKICRAGPPPAYAEISPRRRPSIPTRRRYITARINFPLYTYSRIFNLYLSCCAAAELFIACCGSVSAPPSVFFHAEVLFRRFRRRNNC